MADVSFAVDVSNNQASHQPWKTWGIHMGIAKASEGQHGRDAWFAQHITDIKADRLVPAAYHFAWPNQSAAAEAANYIGAVRDYAAPLFVHALDLERYPDGARNYVGASSAQVRQYAHDWIAAVKKAFPGQRVGIYTSGDDIRDGHLPGNQDFLWYPAYPVQGRTFAQAASATRPAPSGHTVWGWQFASVPRDQTVIYLSPAALHTWAGGGTPTVQEDDDMPTPQDYAKAVWEYKEDDPTRAGTQYMNVKDVVWWIGAHAGQTSTQIAALTATVNTLAAQLGKQGVDTAAVIAAVQKAIADATVHVQVDVTGNQASE